MTSTDRGLATTSCRARVFKADEVLSLRTRGTHLQHIPPLSHSRTNRTKSAIHSAPSHLRPPTIELALIDEDACTTTHDANLWAFKSERLQGYSKRIIEAIASISEQGGVVTVVMGGKSEMWNVEIESEHKSYDHYVAFFVLQLKFWEQRYMSLYQAHRTGPLEKSSNAQRRWPQARPKLLVQSASAGDNTAR